MTKLTVAEHAKRLKLTDSQYFGLTGVDADHPRCGQTIGATLNTLYSLERKGLVRRSLEQVAEKSGRPNMDILWTLTSNGYAMGRAIRAVIFDWKGKPVDV